MGVSGLKVSFNKTLLKWQEKGLLAEGDFLQRAAYRSRNRHMEFHVVPLTINNPSAEFLIPVPTTLDFASLERRNVSITAHNDGSTELEIKTDT